MNRLLLSLVFSFTACCLYAQADTVQANKWVLQAKKCLKANKIDSVQYYHTSALRVFKEKNLLAPWLKSYSSLAYVWDGDLNQPFKAIEVVETSLREKWREPVDASEWESLAFSNLAAGHFYRVKLSDLFTAKTYYEKAVDIFTTNLHEEGDRLAYYLYHNLANIYTRYGDYERAISLLRRSLEYKRRHPKANVIDHGDLALALNVTGKYQEALEVIRQGLAIEGIKAKAKISILQNEADVYFKLGQPEKAFATLERIPALIAEMVQEGGGVNEKNCWMQYHNSKAELYAALGNMGLAETNYHQAIAIGGDKRGADRRREIGKMYGSLGAIKARQNKHREALAYFHQSLQSVVPNFDTSDIFQLPDAKNFIPENTILEALEGKAQAFRALGMLERALECYELIPVVETKLRATYAYESSSLLALSESRHRFDEAVTIAWQLYERSQGNRVYADRAFRLTEQARGMLLLQSLAQAQAKYQLPAEVRQRENDLNNKIAWYTHEIAAEREAAANPAPDEPVDPNRLPRLEKEQYDLKQANETFKAELRQRFPEYAALSDEIHFLESSEVAGLLRTGQAMLDYYLTETDVFIFALDAKGGFSWRKTTIPPGFRDRILAFVQYLQQGEEENKAAALQFRVTASDLYELLLAPELKQLTGAVGSLMIVPDDALVFVPFEVLLRRPATEGNWRDLPWLLTDYNTGYAYSATLLQMQQTISRKHRERQESTRFVFGGFAPSYSASGVYNLTSTTALVNSAKTLLGGKTWSGAKASEEKFKKVAPDCRLLLLAMHGLADAENPELSRLLFGDPGPDSIANDNVLYASELQIMQLQADLAVLSACHSGFGKLQKGEGVYSLARAFAQAGVPATVMSLWLLHENTASPLVQSFLQYLQAGKSKDEALRLAKLDFLKSDENFDMAHPFFWAGVTTSGDMCGLVLEKPGGYWWWWLGLGLLGLGIGWVFVRRRRRS